MPRAQLQLACSFAQNSLCCILTAEDFPNGPGMPPNSIEPRQVGCSCNVAFYFVSMPGFNISKHPDSKGGDFYCGGERHHDLCALMI